MANPNGCRFLGKHKFIKRGVINFSEQTITFCYYRYPKVKQYPNSLLTITVTPKTKQNSNKLLTIRKQNSIFLTILNFRHCWKHSQILHQYTLALLKAAFKLCIKFWLKNILNIDQSHKSNLDGDMVIEYFSKLWKY